MEGIGVSPIVHVGVILDVDSHTHSRSEQGSYMV